MPPVAAAYQSMVSPVPAVAERLTVPDPHLERGVVAVIAGTATLVIATVSLYPTQPLPSVMATL